MWSGTYSRVEDEYGHRYPSGKHRFEAVHFYFLSREIECCGGGSSVCSKRVSVAGLPLPSCLFNDRRLIPGHSVFRDRIHYGAKVLELVELIPLDAYATRRKRSIGGCYAT